MGGFLRLQANGEGIKTVILRNRSERDVSRVSTRKLGHKYLRAARLLIPECPSLMTE